MSRAVRRSTRTPSSRGRRTPAPPTTRTGLRIPWVPILVLVGVVIAAVVVVYLVIQSGKAAGDRYAKAVAMEEDQAAGLPGEYVNLPQVWANGSTLAHYGNNNVNTNAHVARAVDYSKETSPSSPTGLPPVGGPHWGSTTCGSDPKLAPAFCGPVPWGIYRDPWPAESMVHNMEHGGVVIWYNLSGTTLRDQIETEVTKLGKKGGFIVMTPYSGIPANTIAFTAWTRREIVPAAQYTTAKLDDFIKKFNCRFNPEGFTCGNM